MTPRTLVLFVIGFLLAPAVHGRNPYSDSYPKNLGIDVIGYVFDIEVTDANDVIHGQTAVDVRFVEPSSSLRLDLISRSDALEGRGMTVTRVESGGEALEFALTPTTPSRSTLRYVSSSWRTAHRPCAL